MIAGTIEREARELRLPVLAVDRPLDEMIERAAEQFAPAVARLPRGGDLTAVRAFEAQVLETQVRLYEQWLAKAVPAGGSAR